MRAELFAALVCIALFGEVRATQIRPTTLACGRVEEVLVKLDRTGATQLIANAQGTSWLEIEEGGVDVDVDGTPSDAFKITVPTRYGRFFVPVNGVLEIGLRRAQASNGPIDMRAKLHCDWSAQGKRVAWYRRAAAVSQQLMPTPSGRAPEELLGEVAHLDVGDEEPAMRALVAHLRAQTLYTANRTTEAAQAFAEAETDWLRAGDNSRALAARVGRVEELIRAARYEDALKLVTESERTSSASYFAKRLEATRCQIERYLGRLKEAVPCYDKSSAWLEKQGEQTELASMMLDQADVLRQTRQLAQAEKRASRAHDLATGPYAPIVRGRADLLLYDLLLDRGDAVGALRDMQGALEEFASIRAVRWEANAMLRAAWLYVQLGAIDEAKSLLVEVRARLSEKDAPARVAAAWMLSADADAHGGQFDPALLAARSAEAIFSRLEMPVELDGARLLIADVLLKQGDYRAAENVIRNRKRDARGDTPAWKLLEARSAIVDRRLNDARLLLDALGHERLRFAQDVARVELEGLWLARSGEHEQAQRTLRAAAQRIVAASDRVANPLLAALLERSLAPLRALSIELALEDASSTTSSEAGPDIAWRWLTLQSDFPPYEARVAKGDALREFDEHVAQELLSDPGRTGSDPQSLASRNLLTLLASETQLTGLSTGPLRHPMTLGQFQSRAPTGSAFVAYFDASRKGAMLWVDRDHASLVSAPPAKELSPQVAALTKEISSPETPLAVIEAASEKLSRQLFANAPIRDAPAELMVQMSPELGSIPWAALRWRPGDDDLIVHATISFVHMRAGCCAKSNARATILHVLIPDQSADAVLNALPNASMEPRLIEDAVQRWHFHVETSVVTDRSVVLENLKRSGSWVHIAAHGQTNPEKIGYSGIWMESSGDRSPVFLSGIDILDDDVKSELVVLDACDLGERRGDSMRPTLNFADAVSRAGGKNVIAALWPISDAAVTLWVPTFYRAATSSDVADFGGALRNAQLTMRSSRRYRHPYYWAPLIYSKALGIDPQ